MLTVRWLRPAEADDAELVAHVVDVVNRAYRLAEIDLWTKDIPRTDEADTAESIRDGETAVAESDGVIVGALRAKALDADTWWFGALGVDPRHAGRGVGRTLVDFVEEEAAGAGARTMRLEVLEADPPLDHLVRLAAWYERRGYREVGRARVAERFADDADSLTKACDVVELVRDLPTPARRPAG
ncbi:MAG TPA: GNAT family N-acetyltransferase [Actinomycetota bacterium]